MFKTKEIEKKFKTHLENQLEFYEKILIELNDLSQKKFSAKKNIFIEIKQLSKLYKKIYPDRKNDEIKKIKELQIQLEKSDAILTEIKLPLEFLENKTEEYYSQNEKLEQCIKKYKHQVDPSINFSEISTAENYPLKP